MELVFCAGMIMEIGLLIGFNVKRDRFRLPVLIILAILLYLRLNATYCG